MSSPGTHTWYMDSILTVFFYLGQGTNGKGRKKNTVQVENMCRAHDGLGGVCNMNVCTVALGSVFPTHSDVKFSLGLRV